MIKHLLAWNFRRKETRIYKQTAFQLGKESKRKGKPTMYDFTGDGFYSHEKPARKNYLKYFLGVLFLLGGLVWFVLEAIKGWNFFEL